MNKRKEVARLQRQTYRHPAFTGIISLGPWSTYYKGSSTHPTSRMLLFGENLKYELDLRLFKVNVDLDICALLWTVVLTSIIGAAMFPLPSAWHRIRDYLEENRPIIIDIILMSPLGRLWTHLRRYYGNLLIVRNNRPSLLKLPDDVLYEICLTVLSIDCRSGSRYAGRCIGCSISRKALMNLSGTSKHMRELSSPLPFQAVKIDQRHGWWRASRALRAVEDSAQIKTVARIIDVDIDERRPRCEKLPKAFALRLASTLSTLQKLEKLVLNIPEHHFETFYWRFKDSHLTLPTVRTLVLGPCLEWIIDMCPNVEVISSHRKWPHGSIHRHTDAYKLIKAAGRADKFHHFELSGWWERDYVLAVHEVMPKLKSLAMPGPKYRDGIKELLKILAHFESLQTLMTAEIWKLGVGYRSSGCGNPYLGRGGEQRMREDEKRAYEASQEVAVMVLGELKELETLWIGRDRKASVLRTVTGGVKEVILSYEERPEPSSEY